MLLRSTTRCCTRIRTQRLLSLFIEARRHGHFHALGNKPHKSAEERLAISVGPLYELIEKQKLNVKSPDSCGNTLYSLKNFYEENIAVIETEELLAKFLSIIRSKLESHQSITNGYFFQLIHIVKKHNLLQAKFYHQLLFDLAIYMVEVDNENAPIDVQILEMVSNSLIFSKFLKDPKSKNFANLINYSIMIQKLNEQKYFEELAPRLVFQIVYTPFLRQLNKEQYVLRTINLSNALDFVRYYESHPHVYRHLLKMIKPDIITSLEWAIAADDIPKIKELWRFYIKNYEYLISEDFQTLLYQSIENGNAIMLGRLLLKRWNFRNSKPKFSKIAQRQVASILLNHGDYDGFYNFFELSEDCPVWERSCLIEPFLDSVTLIDYFKLINEVTRSDEVLLSKDFDYLVSSFYSELRKRNAKLTLAQIENLVNETILQSTDLENNVKSLYINCFLKALAMKTNISGVIHGYCQLPVQLFTKETFKILLNTFTADPLHCSKRTSELFRFASNNLEIQFTIQEYNMIIRNTVDNDDFVDFHQIYYYYYQYLKRNDASFLPQRLIDLVLTNKQARKRYKRLELTDDLDELLKGKFTCLATIIKANEKQYTQTPLEILELVINKIGADQLKTLGVDLFSKSVENYYLEDYEPSDTSETEFDHYDHIDAKKLKMKHRISIQNFIENGPQNIDGQVLKVGSTFLQELETTDAMFTENFESIDEEDAKIIKESFDDIQDPLVETHDPFGDTHDLVDGTHDPSSEAHDPPIEAHDPVDETHDPLVETHDPFGETHDLIDGTHDPVGETRDPSCEAHDPVGETHDLVGETHDPAVETHDPVGGTHDPSSEAHDPVDETHDLVGETHDPVDEPRDPIDEPHDLADEPRDLADKTHDPDEQNLTQEK